jgi:hypothetical protein
VSTTGSLLLLSVLLGPALSSGPQDTDAASPDPFSLELIPPLRLSTTRTVAAAASLLDDADRQPDAVDRAINLLWKAAREDPWQVGVWVNLSAAYIRRCRPDRAIFAAMVARSMAPDLPAAATNLGIARRLDCPEPPSPSGVEQAEWGAIDAGGSASGWREAASARRDRGDRSIAALYEQLAVTAGASRGEVAASLASDLESAGMWREAASALAQSTLGSAVARRAELLARLRELEPRARALAHEVVARLGLDEGPEAEGAVTVCEALLARGMDPESALETIVGWFGDSTAERVFAGTWGVVRAPEAWTSVSSGAGGWPPLVLRRFPGDTQLSFHPCTAGSDSDVEGTCESLVARMGGVLSRPWVECEGAPSSRCLSSVMEIDLGVEGRGRMEAWLVDAREEGGTTILVLALVGDAGCGNECERSAREAAGEVVYSWTPPGQRPAESFDPPLLPIPRAWQGSRLHRESEWPWRAFPVGSDARVDLPPGVVVASVGGESETAGAAPGNELWFRGRFEDREGKLVVVGDSETAGTVELHSAGPDAEGQFTLPPELWTPRSDPDAEFVAFADLGPALRRAGTGSTGGVARFQGRTFEGTWLVMRSMLAGSGDLVELEVPVVKGVDSLSLLWIPLTARKETTAAPPPIVDLAARFEIRFRPISAPESRVDPREGVLDAAEVRLAVPRDFRVSLNAGSRDGFPVTLRGGSGGRGTLDRWQPGEATDVDARRRQAESREGGAPPTGWRIEEAGRGGSVHYAEWPASDGTPGAYVALLLPDADAGMRAAFRVRLERTAEVDESTWEVWKQIVRQSLEYRKR